MAERRARVITENTRVSLTLVTFVSVVVAIVVMAMSMSKWTTQVEGRLVAIEKCNDDQQADIDGLKAIMVETQTVLVEIKTDVKWLVIAAGGGKE